jgi:hypothetical protein
MGAAPSRRLLEDPFPVRPSLAQDLGKLSAVASRILSKPDIFDIDNLKESGTCGKYAVFLKKEITRQLLPFVAKMSDGTIAEILYQNPSKVISKEADREAICSQLTDSMLRLVSVVIGCLASIQIARPGAPQPLIQRGGAIAGVIQWLVNAGYIAPSDAVAPTPGKKYALRGRPGRSGAPVFSLTFTDDRAGTYHGLLTAQGTGMPTGSMKIQMVDPIEVPGTGEAILPIRVTDNAGTPWMVGILCRDLFETLNASNETMRSTGGVPPADIWELLFQRAAGSESGRRVPHYETRAELEAANGIFNLYQRSRDRRIILNAMTPYLVSVLGYTPGYVDPAAAAYGMPAPLVPGPMYPGGPVAGGLIPRYPIPQQYPLSYAQPPPPSLRPITGPAAPSRPISLVPGAGVKYEIPPAAGKYITDTLTAFRQTIPTLTSPAAARVYTLVANVDASRIVQTNICNDPYWSQKNLGGIYPWVAFQLLCVDNWKALTPDMRDPSSNILSSDWTNFLGNMFDLYNDTHAGLKVRMTNRSGLLTSIRFENMSAVPLCSDPARQRTGRLDIIQDAVTALRKLYDAHVKKVWEILNSLIVVVQVPGTMEEVVRLHPQVFKGGEASQDFIKKKADEARKAIAAFYLGVESTYLDTVARLVAASA